MSLLTLQQPHLKYHLHPLQPQHRLTALLDAVLTPVASVDQNWRFHPFQTIGFQNHAVTKHATVLHRHLLAVWHEILIFDYK